MRKKEVLTENQILSILYTMKSQLFELPGEKKIGLTNWGVNYSVLLREGKWLLVWLYYTRKLRWIPLTVQEISGNIFK